MDSKDVPIPSVIMKVDAYFIHIKLWFLKVNYILCPI